MTTPPKIYSYVRFSSERQLSGDSLRRQNELIDKYVKERGLELDDKFRLVDLAVSAFTGKNATEGSLKYFLQAIDEKKVAPGSILLVESLDRLTRQKITDALTLLLNIILAGVTIVTLIDGQEHNRDEIDKNSMNLFVSVVALSRAHEESQVKSQRLKRAWENKRSKIGKEYYSRRVPSWLKMEKGETKPTVIPEKAETVRWIFQQMLEGSYADKITWELNKGKVPLVGKSKAWSSGYVIQILRNRSVTGIFTPHRMVDGKRTPTGIELNDYYPQIVSPEIFNRVQFIMDSRVKNKPGGRKSVGAQSLFRKLLFCGYCGASVYTTYKGRKYKGDLRRVLVCRNVKEHTGCFYVGWHYDEFEKSFLQSAVEVRGRITDKFDGKTLREERDTLTTELQDLHRRNENLRKLAEEMANDGVAPRTIGVGMRENETRITEVAKRIEKIEHGLNSGLVGSQPLQSLEKLMDDLANPTTRQLASDLISQVYDRIDLYPAGNRFQFAKFKSMHGKLMKENNNTRSVAAKMREGFERRSVRFFEAVLRYPGANKRIRYSDKDMPVAVNQLEIVEDLPAEIDP